MELKDYQQQALETLERYLNRTEGGAPEGRGTRGGISIA